MNKYHMALKKCAEEDLYNCLFVRFEELLTNSEEQFSKMIRFMMGVSSIEGTIVEHNLKEMIKKKESVSVYKPKSTSFNYNTKRYTPE